MPTLSKLSQMIIQSPKVYLVYKSLVCMVAIVSLILTCINFTNARSIVADAFTLCLIILTVLDVVQRVLSGVTNKKQATSESECASAQNNWKCYKLSQSMKDATNVQDCTLLCMLTVALLMKTCIKFDDDNSRKELNQQKVFICACQVIILGALLCSNCMGLAASICNMIDRRQQKLVDIDHRQYSIREPSQLSRNQKFSRCDPQHKSPSRKQFSIFNEHSDSSSKYQQFLQQPAHVENDYNHEHGHEMQQTQLKNTEVNEQVMRRHPATSMDAKKDQQNQHQI